MCERVLLVRTLLHVKEEIYLLRDKQCLVIELLINIASQREETEQIDAQTETPADSTPSKVVSDTLPTLGYELKADDC